MRSTLFCIALLLGTAVPAVSAEPPAVSAEDAEPADSPEELASWDFRRALEMWKNGHYGGVLFYHDGRGPLGRELRKTFLARDEDAAKPEEWDVTSLDCQSEIECSVTTIIRFTDEEIGGLRRYRLVREPGQFWGLYSEERLECPDGYRLQYQGICMNIEDERSDDPDVEVRTADPIGAG